MCIIISIIIIIIIIIIIRKYVSCIFNVFFVFYFQDCRYFKSKKTGRGPLKEGWRVSRFLYKGEFVYSNTFLIGIQLNS